MTQVCHECGDNLYNPFYEVSLALVDRKSGRVTLSELSTTVCKRHYSPDWAKINPIDMNSELVLAIDEAHGCLGGVTDAVQMCTDGGLDRHLQFKYVDLDVGKTKFPKSMDLLVKSPDWMEYINGEWQRAMWADEIYTKMQEKE